MKHFIALTLLIAPAFVNADTVTTEKEPCQVMDVASLSYVENIQDVNQADVGAIYKARTEKLIAFGKEHKLAGFKITSQDASVSANCCGNFGLQVNMSYQITYKPSYEAFSALQKHSGSGMISTYRVGMDMCDASK